MRGYLALMRGAFTIGLVYRFGFLFTILGNVIYMSVAYFLWSSIYSNSTQTTLGQATIHGLTFNETFIYVALGSTVFVLLKTYTDWIISHEIEDGSIAIYLTKPVEYLYYVLSMSLGAVLTNLAAITIPTLLLLTLVFKVTFTFGPGLLLFPVSLLLAFLVSYCFDCITGLFAFYTESIWGISTTKEILLSVLSGALVPLQFFPDALQKVLLVLPFQAIYHTPLMMVTRPNQDWGTLLSMLGVQIIWVIILLMVTRLFYNQAIKVLRVAGGEAMLSLREYLRLYFIIEAQYIKARMQYRADFIISSIGMFFSSLATLGVFWVIFNSVPTLAGWTFMEMVFIYAFYMIAISPMQILFDQTWWLRYAVQQGAFLKYYFRPLNMMFYFMSERFDIKGLTQLALGIGLLIYSSIQLGIEWSPIKLVLLPLSLFGAALVLIALTVAAGCAAFWITNAFPVISLAWKLREFSPYPMNIFDGLFRFTFSFILPIGFIAFYPSQMFLRPEQINPMVYFSPLVGVLMFALSYWIWTKGVNSYSGTGS